jgi:hypothetical protein
MPQIADLEIAATWDEIELEAALRGEGAEAEPAPSAATVSSLSEALRAVEDLQRLPKTERKRRAEELLRTLTSALSTPVPELESAPHPAEPIAAPEPPAAEPIAELPQVSELMLQEPAVAKPVAESPQVSELVLQEPPAADPVGETPKISEPRAEALPTAETVEAPLEISEPLAEELSSAPAAALAEVADSSAQDSASAETVEAPPEIAGFPSEEPLPALFPEGAEAAAAEEPVQESPEPCGSAPVAEVTAVEDPAAETALDGSAAEATVEAAPEPSSLPAAASEPYPIPKFLATECPSLELEQPDSLIPFRTAAAACAVIGAVLLIYFGSSQELGIAARPNLGASEPMETRTAPREIPLSLAMRQAFVAEPPAYSPATEPLRSYRPPFVGFDFLDDPAPPPPSAAKAEPPVPETTPPVATPAEIPSEPPPEAQIVPQAPAEETAVLTSAPTADADLAALVKRGDALLKAGDIAAARSAYERAAAGGSAKAEIGVGKTYDPLVLAKLGARGVRGDPVQAASWYARAGEAGDEEGQQRLHALISGLSDCMLAQGACAPRKP